MAAIAQRPPSLERRPDRSVRWPMQSQEALCEQVSIRASEDGWSLLDSRGIVLFRGLGLRSWRQCLEFARDMGVLVVHN
jgi:hypothetical protein